MKQAYALLAISTLLCLVVTTVAVVRPRKVHVSYPVDLLGTNSDTYSGNLTHDKLTCLGNRDYGVPTYKETMMCMIGLPMGFNCNSIWGSRSVVVEVTGSVEFLKLSRLPPGSVFNEMISLNATRWLELTVSSNSISQKEIIQVPAEPIYLCARSNDWTGLPANFRITFRPVYIRSDDQKLCHSKTRVHVALVAAVTSIWLLPYIAAIVVAALSFMHGIKFTIVIISFSGCVVLLTPLMLTRKNRHLARLYLKYFFTRIQAEETKMVFRQRMPVFQALFFSSALVCIGAGGSYITYTYCGIDRELRNLLLKITIGVASSWFVFFLCRSFERFCRDWVWVPMSVCLAQLLDLHLNPLSRDEVVASTLLISLGISFIPRIARAAQAKLPEGARTVAPRLRVWANKVKVSIFNKTLNLQRQSLFRNDDAQVSMAFEGDYVENNADDVHTSNFDRQSNFATSLNDMGSECGGLDLFGDEDEDEDQGVPTACARMQNSVSKNRLEDQKSVYSRTDPQLQQQLWECLGGRDAFESELPTPTGAFSRTLHGSASKRGQPSTEMKRSLSDSFLDLFLTGADAVKIATGETENSLPAVIEQLSPMGRTSFGFLSSTAGTSSNAVDNRKLDRQSNEQRNRRALSRVVGFDLSGLRLALAPVNIPTEGASQVKSTEVDEDRGEENREVSVVPDESIDLMNAAEVATAVEAHCSSSIACTHVVGAMSCPISALGPVRLDNRSCWIPMACNDPSLTKTLQSTISHLATTTFHSSLFPAVNVYHTSYAVLRASTFADAIFVQRWLTHPSNWSVLRSIARGDSFGAVSSDDDYLLSANVTGKEVKVLLKILTVASDLNDDQRDGEEEDDVEDHRQHVRQRGDTLLASQWWTMGYEAIQRVVSVALEDLNEVVSTKLISIHGSEGECDQYASSAFVGIECTLGQHTLQTLGINNLEAFLAARDVFERSNCFSSSSKKGHIARVAAAVLTSLGLDTSDISDLITHCMIDMCVVPSLADRSGQSSPPESSELVDPVFGAKESLGGEESDAYRPGQYSASRRGSQAQEGLSLSMSLSIPISIPNRLYSTRVPLRSGGGGGPKGTVPLPDQRTGTSGVSSSGADTCYQLLAGNEHMRISGSLQKPLYDEGDCAASRALAATLLIAHVSQLVDLEQNGLFPSSAK